MKMTPGFRKIALTAHVACSVGWLGTVASFLILSVAGLNSRDMEIVRGAYLAMNVTGQYIIVPLSFAALLTGIVQSLGTEWGLLRYYWVFVKFVLTLGATFLLLLHQFTAVAEAARRVSAAPAGTMPEIGGFGGQLVFDAGLAVLVLLGITALSVFKPWGRTPYGQRQLQEDRGPRPVKAPRASLRNLDNREIGGGLPRGLKLLLAAVGLFVAIIIILHLFGRGFMSHGH